MARRNNRQTIDESPEETSVFRTTKAGGSDGDIGTRDILVTCSEGELQYRVEVPADPTDEWANLAAGEAVRLRGTRQEIHHIIMRGVDGEATGGVEVLDL